ncbi:nuclease-related domain-containing protein [Nocardia farcinica]|nr:nuclease-related domain-containing protein [Nocardia farcinica]
MMPAFCPDEAPPGEKAVYSALRDCGDTDEWLVLHSLGIANHVRQVEGEADFVVIVPDTGILVIEVKSHQSVHRRLDGTWRLGNDSPTARGPFQQAREAMHSLRSYLEKRNVDLRSIPMLSAVWFTGVRARTMLPSSPEWHGWQVLDSEDVKSAPTA